MWVLLLVLTSTVIIGYQHPSVTLALAEFLFDMTRNNTLISSLLLTKYGKVFITLFLFRFIRLIVNYLGFCLYKPYISKGALPVYLAQDVTVIVPTVDPAGIYFKECIRSILNNMPAKLIIVTAGKGKNGQVNYERLCQDWADCPGVQLIECEVMNKRRQLCKAIPMIETAITIFTDDHIFYPRNFLNYILAPFDDPRVGIVGVSERVRRTIPNYSLAAFCNVLAAIYSEQEVFGNTATYAIDKGVYVIGGRTSAHRTSILRDKSFITSFLNEYCCFGLVGPLNADDDNFIYRWNVRHGWRIGYQNCDGARIEFTAGDIGGFEKYLSQNLRWMRTKWRTYTTGLLEDYTSWKYPWCLYSVNIAHLFNLALFYDGAMLYTLWRALQAHNDGSSGTWMILLCVVIFVSKVVKIIPYWWRNPADLVYLPACVLFGYYHSLIKLYALLTFWNTGWGSRKLSGEEKKKAAQNDQKERKNAAAQAVKAIDNFTTNEKNSSLAGKYITKANGEDIDVLAEKSPK